MARSLAASAAVVLCMLATHDAVAQPDVATIELAKQHYKNGDAAYNLGRFDEAVEWFTKAYEAWPVADFLYNIAQSYRQAGNCKQALFSYRRYLSLKQKDDTAPLTHKERAEIERFIRDLTECARKADSTAARAPDGLKTTTLPSTPTTATPTAPTPSPTQTPTAPTPSPTQTPTPTTTRPATAPNTMTAALEDPEDEPEVDDPEITEITTTEAKVLAAYATGGLAIFPGGGDLSIPAQPSFAVGAGYPLPITPVSLDIGARVSYSPISYQFDVMGSKKQASLIGIQAMVGVTYRVNDKLSLRGDAGIGLAMLGGLVDGNPFTDTRKAGSFNMLSVRAGAAAEYEVAPKLFATVAPLGLSFSPAPEELFISSLLELDVLVGLGYRM